MKIHIGCGKRDFGPGWINIDQEKFPHVHHSDIFNLPCQRGTVDLIYSSHVIEYFDRFEIFHLLSEWNAFLRPGGTLRVAVPNFEVMSKLYVEKKCDLSNILGPLYGRMKSGQGNIYHKTTYDFDSLRGVLEKSGFVDVRLYDWRKTEHAQHDDHSQAYYPHMDKENGTLISLNVECTKP